MMESVPQSFVLLFRILLTCAIFDIPTFDVESGIHSLVMFSAVAAAFWLRRCVFIHDLGVANIIMKCAAG